MEKITKGVFKGRAIYMNTLENKNTFKDDFDYEFVIHSDKNLYIIDTSKDFSIKAINEIEISKDLIPLFENPKYLEINGYTKDNKGEVSYFGYIVSNINPDVYVSFQVNNDSLKVTNVKINAQDIIDETKRHYMNNLNNIINNNTSVIESLTDIKYIVKHRYVYIIGQVREKGADNLIFLQYEYDKDCILIEKEYFSEKYTITYANLFVNSKEGECFVYGSKKIKGEDSPEVLFLDRHVMF